MKQFIEYVLKDNKDIHKTNDFFEDTYELQFVDKFFFKKTAHAFFWAPYFFQVFWRENSPHLNGVCLQNK